MEAVYRSSLCHKKRLPTSHVLETPTKILNIKEPESTGIRAVTVVEHRNIGAQMDWMKDNMHRTVIVVLQVLEDGEEISRSTTDLEGYSTR